MSNNVNDFFLYKDIGLIFIYYFRRAPHSQSQHDEFRAAIKRINCHKLNIVTFSLHSGRKHNVYDAKLSEFKQKRSQYNLKTTISLVLFK